MKLKKLEKLLLNVSEGHFEGIFIDGGKTKDGIYGTIYDGESGRTLIEYYTDNGDLAIDIIEWDDRIAQMVEISGL